VLGRILTNGPIKIDTNAVHSTFRPIVLNRKNAYLAGRDAGAETCAIIAALIETGKLSVFDSPAWLVSTLTANGKVEKQSQIGELLRWTLATKV